MKTLGIVFSNIYDDFFGEMTRNRTVASLPFGGRYRLIDFVLSNMSNSGIYQVGLITKYNYRSLMDHLGSCAEWDLNRKNERLVLLPPFASGNTGVYKGKLEALYSAEQFIEDNKYDYVVMSDCTVLCNIDYKPAIEEHIKSGADITVITTPFSKGKHPLTVIANKKKRVTEIELDSEAKEGASIGTGMFIISRKLLSEAISEAHSKGYVHFERDFIQKRFNDNKLTVNMYQFDGVVLRNESISQYLANNLSLTDKKIRDGLFLPERPIYTKVRDEHPTYFGKGASLEHCIVADGCTLNGKAINSVLFRNVVLENNCTVKNSMILQGSIIGAGSKLENVILDMDVVISPETELKGTPEHPVIISKGAAV